MRSDESIRDVVTAAIRRRAIDQESWNWTRLWESADPAIRELLARDGASDPGELPILYSYIDRDNWTLFTSRAIRYADAGRCSSISIAEIAGHDFGIFKNEDLIARLTIRARDGVEHRCPYHSGREAMGPIAALTTLRQITSV